MSRVWQWLPFCVVVLVAGVGGEAAADPQGVGEPEPETADDGSLEAAAAADGACRKQIDGGDDASGPFDVLPIGRRFATRVDGGGGVDTYSMPGPADFVFDGNGIRSFERIDIRNRQFDTVAILEGLFETSDSGEIQVIADWFDTVVLDPTLDWSASLDVEGEGMVLEAQATESTWRVWVPLGVNLITAPTNPILTTAAWSQPDAVDAGDPWQGVMERDGQMRHVLYWPEAGEADLEGLADLLSVETVLLDLQNDAPNRLQVDARALAGISGTTLEIRADPQDRLHLTQPACWSPPAEVVPGDTRLLLQSAPSALDGIALSGPPSLQPKPLDEAWLPVMVPVAEDGPFFHLSADTARMVGAIDLSDGQQTVLMISLDGRLFTDQPIRIEGDPGLDSVWLDGAAGWTLEQQGGGVSAMVPYRDGNTVELQFGAGIRLSVLPRPPYIDDPRLSRISHFPGMPDEPTGAAAMSIVTGGTVRFSADQLDGVSRVDFTNGIENVIELNPENIAKAARSLAITGDVGLDIVRATGLIQLGGPDQAAGSTVVFEAPRGGAGGGQRVTVQGLLIAD